MSSPCFASEEEAAAVAPVDGEELEAQQGLRESRPTPREALQAPVTAAVAAEAAPRKALTASAETAAAADIPQAAFLRSQR